MLHKGVHYDTGIVFRGPGYSISSRREALENATVRRELEIIRDDLHANAVRIVGSTLSRLVSTSEIALELGLEVWFSPMYFNYEMEETSAKLIEAASAASRFLSAHPNRVVFVGGSELTLFSKGFFPGNDIKDRLTALRSDPALLRDTKLNDFFSGLVPRLRAEFSGPIVYASLIFEQVDWELFDFIGVDHYRDDRVKDRYVQMLEPLLESAKPVIITEFGMRTYRGAQGSGALGFGVTDTTRLYLHSLPIIGRFVRPRLRGVYERDEALQAREIGETLSELERAGVAGALLSTFTTPQARSDINPRYDLDIDSMSIVKALPRGQHGTSYPDMAWEPKEAFDVVARHFLQQGSPTDQGHPRTPASPRISAGRNARQFSGSFEALMRAHLTLTPKQFTLALACVALGGGVGTFLRDVILRIDSSHWYLDLTGASPAAGTAAWYSQIPWTLMVINILGVYAVAKLLVGRLRAHDPNNLSRVLIVTGFFGGLTSYSSLFVSFDAIWHLSRVGALSTGALAVLSGVGAGWLGVRRRHR